MERQDKYKVKMFLWDQLVRPFHMFINVHQLKPIILALIIANFVIFKIFILFWGLVILLGIIFIYEIYKYWKSGEFIHNYRKFKYPEYRKAIKTLKRKSKHLNTLNNLNKDRKSVWEKLSEPVPSLNNGKNEQEGQGKEVRTHSSETQDKKEV
jgi:hypothetical protein